MWCWRRVKKRVGPIVWGGKEVLRSDKGERNILNTIKRRKGNWVGHISRRKCVVKHVIEGNV